MNYNYFVSYAYQKGETKGLRSASITMPYKIRSGEDIDVITKELAKSNNISDLESIVILNWKRFEEC